MVLTQGDTASQPIANDSIVIDGSKKCKAEGLMGYIDMALMEGQQLSANIKMFQWEADQVFLSNNKILIQLPRE